MPKGGHRRNIPGEEKKFWFCTKIRAIDPAAWPVLLDSAYGLWSFPSKRRLDTGPYSGVDTWPAIMRTWLEPIRSLESCELVRLKTCKLLMMVSLSN